MQEDLMMEIKGCYKLGDEIPNENDYWEGCCEICGTDLMLHYLSWLSEVEYECPYCGATAYVDETCYVDEEDEYECYMLLEWMNPIKN